MEGSGEPAHRLHIQYRDRVERRRDARLSRLRRPTVTLIMGDLQKAGLVENGRGTIHIMDRPGLETASCECYETIKAARGCCRKCDR
jgi:hypothetical protein